MSESPYEPPPPLDVIVADNSLPLADAEDFASHYTVLTAGEVRLLLRWGGPAAGGPGWGGPEIAVIIVIGELLRRTTSDAYDLVKAFIVDTYSRIRTRNAARWYVDGALALAIDSDTRALRLLFCFPEGLDKASLQERIRLVEAHQQEVLAEWSSNSWVKPRNAAPLAEIKLCWDDRAGQWVECQPPPANMTDG